MVERMPLQTRQVQHLAPVNNLEGPEADTINDINPETLQKLDAPALNMASRTPTFDMGGMS